VAEEEAKGPGGADDAPVDDGATDSASPALAASRRPKRKSVDATDAGNAPNERKRPKPEGRDTSAPVKKNRPTRTRAEATQADAPKRTGLGEFIGQIIQELKKVSWPSSGQLTRFFIVVLVFVVFMITLISLLDLFFGWAMLKLFS